MSYYCSDWVNVVVFIYWKGFGDDIHYVRGGLRILCASFTPDDGGSRQKKLHTDDIYRRLVPNGCEVLFSMAQVSVRSGGDGRMFVISYRQCF